MSINKIYKLGTRAIALLMSLWTLQGCVTNDSDENLSNDKVAVDLTLCVSPQLASLVTRQPADQTDDPQTDIPQIYGGFRGIQGIQAGDPLVTLIPLSHEDNVFSTIIPSLIEKNVSSTYRHYITSYFTELYIGTEKFLCYAKATPLTSANEADDAKRTFKNGSIVPTLSDKQPANIRFDLAPICPDPDDLGYGMATSLAAYLTDIATAGNWHEVADGKAKEYFDDFTNNSSPIAGSSANLRKWVEIFNEKIAESSIEETLRNAIIAAIDFANIETHIPTSTTYPENIYLPAGAAAMKWSRSEKKFEVMKESDNDSPLSDHKRFTYPAELYYYSYSPIKTSSSSRESDYSSRQWEGEKNEDGETVVVGVLDSYENDDASVTSMTRSVAIKKALNYGVCCMIATLKAVDKTNPEILPTELYDNSETPVAIPLTNAETGKPSFPLVGIMVGGQFRQLYDFTPDLAKDAPEYIIYDTQVPYSDANTPSISLTATNTISTHTLVLQSRDEKPIEVVLEFVNNSGKDFAGYEGGIVYQGTKFYLIGQVWPSTVIGDANLQKRVFTQDHWTILNLNISSLKNAYNVIPNLKTAQYSIKVADVAVKKWTENGNEEYEFYNW